MNLLQSCPFCKNLLSYNIKPTYLNIYIYFTECECKNKFWILYDYDNNIFSLREISFSIINNVYFSFAFDLKSIQIDDFISFQTFNIPWIDIDIFNIEPTLVKLNTYLLFI